VGLNARPSALHDIEAGVDYRRALSFSRRTSVSFGMGSTLVNAPVGVVDGDQAITSELQYRLVGDVGLTHEMGRTWRASVAYSRGIGYSEAFARPVYSDGVNAIVTGFFNRRTDVSASAGFSAGDVGVVQASSSFRAYRAATRARVALTSMWALFAEHQYYKHDLGDAFIVPVGVPSVLDRHSVRVGVTLWVPILRK
jgi:hypothetical protein